jgi:hypothetical protein
VVNLGRHRMPVSRPHALEPVWINPLTVLLGLLVADGFDAAAPHRAAVPDLEGPTRADDVLACGAQKSRRTDSCLLADVRSQPSAVEALAPICR